MSIDKGIWIVSYCKQGQLPQSAYELISKAIKLGNNFNEYVTAVLLGSGLDKLIELPFKYGANRVIYVDEKELKDYDANIFSKVLEMLIKKYEPGSVLFSADSIGSDLAPRIGTKLETGISADCIDLDMKNINGSNLLIQKKTYLNGDVIVDILCKHKRPQIATVKPGILPIFQLECYKIGNIIRESIMLSSKDIFSKILSHAPKISCPNNISKAQVIIAGGRGFRTKHDFDKLYELADLINGVVGATRPLVQQGWISENYQIGQSGQVISPKLYMAFGISGTAQHTCGIVRPGVIIAVNSDPKAPIFNIANYGVVGDSNQVLQGLINVLRMELR